MNKDRGKTTTKPTNGLKTGDIAQTVIPMKVTNKNRIQVIKMEQYH